MISEDTELLRRYAEEKSEDAFAEIVRRHLDSVYAVALRRTGGAAHLAQEVAQNVFADLARKAPALTRHPSLGAWLFRSARFAAAQAVRTEKRRGVREQEAHIMQDLTNHAAASEPNWGELRPVLDEAMEALPERDRVAVWLRVCEGRTFAEIGARLAASEDTVRVRVDRALEKIRGSLARRGIVSTTAALSSALAQETGVIAPVGLAASVTGAALAGASVGGGIAAGLGFSTFMSTTKIAAWSAAAIVLCASLTGNGYLLTHRPANAVASPAVSMSAAAAVLAPAASLGVLAKGDVTTLRDRLRAAGASETTVRGIVEGVLRRRYREALSARRAENMKHAWWKEVPRFNSETSARLADDPKLLREMVLDPLERLFGADPAELAEKEARFEFLPAERRGAYVVLERDYEAALARIPGADQNPALAAGLKRERDEKERQLVAALSPAERAEYELHFSPTAVALRERMNQIAASEQEYRTIMGVVMRPENGGGVARTDAGYAAAEQRGLEQIVAVLGYDRAVDYVWAGAWEYPTYARVAREAGLPPSTPGRVLQLAAETSERAQAIHRDAILSGAERRAALLTLQQQVRPQLDALLPLDHQPRIGHDSLRWFTLLGEGRYTTIVTTAAGTTGSVLTIGNGISVENPLSVDGRRRQFVVRRSSGG